MKNIYYSGLLALVLSFSSCEKFDEGGFVSKADERIIGTWKLEKYLRNGSDETTTLYISNLQEVYQSGGTMIRTFNEKDSDLNTDDATYEFTSDQKELKISGVSSIGDFSSNINSVSSSSLTIVKLYKNEFWYKYTNGSDVHEFHFKKQ